MRFKAKKKAHRLVVKIKTSRDEKIDEKELEHFSELSFRGFMKPKQIRKNKIEYTSPAAISLYEWLKKPISKRELLLIIGQVVVTVQKLADKKMSICNLVTDLKNAYINETTKEIWFVYVPLEVGKSRGNPRELIDSLIYFAKIFEKEDDVIGNGHDVAKKRKETKAISDFESLLENLLLQDMEIMERYIAREEQSVITEIKRLNAGQSGFMTNKPQHYYEHQKERDTVLMSGQDCPITVMTRLDDLTMVISEPEYPPTVKMDEEIGLLHDSNTMQFLQGCVEDTAALNESQTGTVLMHFPTLFRKSTRETIFINKNVFRLGQDVGYVDYFVTNNGAVSRNHAEIRSHDKKYFVVDLNSRNRTYINERPLQIDCEMEICDGDKLMLADEEFVFHV